MQYFNPINKNQMIYKIACAVLLLGVIFLGTRLKVAEDRIQSKIEEMSEKGSTYAESKQKIESLTAQVDELLDENAELTDTIIKLQNQEPQIVTRYVKRKPSINSNASEQFIELLSKRYEFQ